tara:strand:- start:1341 stop:2066 length:726 start_codon:yes stop_codon:yes gene_type:complete
MPIRGLSPRLGNLLAKHIPFGASIFGSQSAPSVNMFPSKNRKDWRTKLTIGSGADSLLAGPVMAPLAKTGGIIFPYTPMLFMQHTAGYSGNQLTHTNYDHPSFENHTIGEIQVTCPFTANTKAEADYMRATLHFLRTVSKMWFGQDTNPIAGTPPPVLRLNAFGEYVMKNVPVVLVAFTMEFGGQVDYISTTDGKTMVPTETTVTTTLKPTYSRAATAKRFSLQNFADGGLLGSTNEGGFI